MGARLGRIGDWLQRIQAFLWALGAAALVLGVIYTLARTIPVPSLLLIGVGVAFISLPFAFWVSAWTRSKVRKYGSSESVPGDGSGIATVVADPEVAALREQLQAFRDELLGDQNSQVARPPAPSFNPRWIEPELRAANFSGLWSDDPEFALDFVLIARSQYKITISGVSGQIYIGNTPCNRPLVAPKVTMAPDNQGGQWPFTIRQPLIERMAESLCPPSGSLSHEDTIIAVGLNQLQLEATVHLPDGDVALKGWQGFGTVMVRGPIRSRDEAVTLSPFQSSVGVRGRVYDSYGRFNAEWKSDHGTEAPQPKEAP